MKGKIVAYLKGLKKEQWIVYLLLGALLVVIAIPVKKKDSGSGTASGAAEETAAPSADEPVSQEEIMAQRLEKALARVEGVGEVQVVLSLESTNQKIVEKDTPTSKTSQSSSDSAGSSSSEASSRDESTVYQKGSDGSETPYVIQETYPEVRGVLVVAQGGDNPVVVQQIQEAVMALFRVEAHKIKVMKMK